MKHHHLKRESEKEKKKIYGEISTKLEYTLNSLKTINLQ